MPIPVCTDRADHEGEFRIIQLHLLNSTWESYKLVALVRFCIQIAVPTLICLK